METSGALLLFALYVMSYHYGSFLLFFYLDWHSMFESIVPAILLYSIRKPFVDAWFNTCVGDSYVSVILWLHNEKRDWCSVTREELLPFLHHNALTNHILMINMMEPHDHIQSQLEK